MKIKSLLAGIVLLGLVTTFSTPLQAANPTTGGGYKGNWLCLNNPNPRCMNR
ncbi:MAG: hypothetical protein AB1589_28465 [Cyanobacteriota bacterium]